MRIHTHHHVQILSFLWNQRVNHKVFLIPKTFSQDIFGWLGVGAPKSQHLRKTKQNTIISTTKIQIHPSKIEKFNTSQMTGISRDFFPERRKTTKSSVVFHADHLVSWWCNPSGKKKRLVSLDHFLNFGDENEKYLKPPPSHHRISPRFPSKLPKALEG